MADLTVLSTVNQLPPHPSLFRHAYSPRASSSRLNLVSKPGSPIGSPVQQKVRPKLSQLEISNRKKETTRAESDTDSDRLSLESAPTVESPEAVSDTASPPHTRQQMTIVSPIPIVGKRPTHKVTRSQSAPPERIRFENDYDDDSTTSRSHTQFAASANLTGQFSPSVKNRPKRGLSTYSMNSTGSFGSRSPAPNEPIKPPPPLHRPTTFWRRTPRSGVTSSSYSPSTHLIRRSTFIAAGLQFDKPMYDVSALGVESRIVHDAVSGKVSETFWEVIEAR